MNLLGEERIGNPSSNLIYWIELVASGVALYYAMQSLFFTKQPAHWRFAWAALAIIPIVLIAQWAVRLFAPQHIQLWISRLTYRQRLALYCLHCAVMIVFLGAGFALIFRPYAIFHGSDSRRLHDFLQWLWIDCLLLVGCFADLSGETRNIWGPRRPTRPSKEENTPSAAKAI